MDDCVKNVRIVNKMRDLNINEDQFLKVIEDIQVKAIERGVPPEMCGELLGQLFNISEVEKIPVEEVPAIIKQRLEEIERIETELRNNFVTFENINHYVSLRVSVAAAGFPNADSNLSHVINFVKTARRQRRISQNSIE